MQRNVFNNTSSLLKVQLSLTPLRAIILSLSLSLSLSLHCCTIAFFYLCNVLKKSFNAVSIYAYKPANSLRHACMSEPPTLLLGFKRYVHWLYSNGFWATIYRLSTTFLPHSVFKHKILKVFNTFILRWIKMINSSILNQNNINILSSTLGWIKHSF